jgi:glycosyltransferase involved in cell wall biosynthesis
MAQVENIEEHVSHLRRLLDDEDLRSRLGSAARQTVERSFSDSIIARQSLRCYREAAGETPTLQRR